MYVWANKFRYNAMKQKYSLSNGSYLNNKKGFTLIELLIVISIIGILSSLLMVNFIGVRQRGRDAQRKSNIRQIQAALELYRTDQSNYPPTSDFNNCGPGSSLTDDNKPPNATYLQTIPCDPLSGQPYQYNSPPGSATYILVACLENINDVDGTKTQPKGFNACSSGEYFVVTNP